MTPKLSIIIPVYNVEKYLRECLNSVVAQTFTDWECILVDDGSKDSSPAICDEYAQRDHRFTVIHKENGGPSSARNLGIETARSAYIYFIDSDDYIEPKTLEIMLNLATKYNTDVVVSAYDYKNPNNAGVWVPSEHDIPQNSHEESAISLSWMNLYWTPWGKLYRSFLIKETGVRYNSDLNVGEDLLFHLSLYPFVSSIATTDVALYHYRYVEGSLDSFSSRRTQNIYLMYAKIVSYLVEHFIRLHTDSDLFGTPIKRLWTSPLLYRLVEYLTYINLILCDMSDDRNGKIKMLYQRSVSLLSSQTSHLSLLQRVPFMYLRLSRPWMRVAILNKLTQFCFS
jgi:glycosyltransferase involved in cell wall biosynthesis